MAHGYKAVSWTPFKKRFDLWMLVGVLIYLVVFVVVSSATLPEGESFTPIQTLIRATGSLGFLLLCFVLCIGPMARLTPRFKPFLYNRRHLGVMTSSVGLIHAGLVLLWYHGFSQTNALVSLLVSNPRYDSIAGFPFESLGLLALVVLFLMAATSHDFWNANLGPTLWKTLHMGVYFAFALVVAHIALGAIQFEKHPVYVTFLATGASVVGALHILAGWLASGAPQVKAEAGWLVVGPASAIPDRRAQIVQPPKGDRIAVFRDNNRVFAVTNVCRHQGGPLGEGRIIDGCITCPWHGFQYRPQDGRSPAPYSEKIATYATRIVNGMVEVFTEPNRPGTPQAPSIIPAEGAE
jgi:nitrite reductase/ring-hydroxylating ferredoxin subunit/DMSO/TMAO reductase YedYZ heme-binding membrane subunit